MHNSKMLEIKIDEEKNFEIEMNKTNSSFNIIILIIIISVSADTRNEEEGNRVKKLFKMIFL